MECSFRTSGPRKSGHATAGERQAHGIEGEAPEEPRKSEKREEGREDVREEVRQEEGRRRDDPPDHVAPA